MTHKYNPSSHDNNNFITDIDHSHPLRNNSSRSFPPPPSPPQHYDHRRLHQRRSSSEEQPTIIVERKDAPSHITREDARSEMMKDLQSCIIRNNTTSLTSSASSAASFNMVSSSSSPLLVDKPCPIQRLPSDGTSILTAARALLSLSPLPQSPAAAAAGRPLVVQTHRNDDQDEEDDDEQQQQQQEQQQQSRRKPLKKRFVMPKLKEDCESTDMSEDEEDEDEPEALEEDDEEDSSSDASLWDESTQTTTHTAEWGSGSVSVATASAASRPPTPLMMATPLSSPKKESTSAVAGGREGPYFTGSTCLALDEDEEALSPLHCFMRRYCVEAFTAGPEDVSSPRYNKTSGLRIVPGQVGIRCLHCKHRTQRQERAVCFPSSLKNIYHSIETWQRRHSLVCRDIPPWIKLSLTKMMKTSRCGAGGRRQYWEESARRLGIEDTDNGLRFVHKPGVILPPPTAAGAAAGADDGASLSSSCHAIMTKGYPVVSEEDRKLVTDYLFVLLDQMETCQFTEQDRSGGRSKVKDCPVGFPGLQCKHCGGKAGFGRYFPNSLRALTSANSDRNIYNHIMKCRRCPSHIRDELHRLQKEQNQQNCKNRRGSRKMLFLRVWQQLHGSSTSTTSTTTSQTSPSSSNSSVSSSTALMMMSTSTSAYER